MDYASQIRRLGGAPEHIEFVEFLASRMKGSAWPDFATLDLMEVPRLVPHIWVVDGREGTARGLKVLFSGTEIDRRFGRNLMGEYLQPGYAEHYSHEAFNAYASVFTDKRPVYVERSDYYPGVEPQMERRIKVVVFPCSSDGETIDFSIGLTKFEKTRANMLAEPVIVQLEPPTP
ncbi:MAG: hypothetical protein JJ900_04570 [Rhodospirillales bacterium]|nr:hypothetical protein [Rhodospirillales bacterium]MBO6786104.1 hypothetical protein [Rhodospirillales bacterium]